MELTHTSIPPDELAVFKLLTDINVIVDVGARDDTEYIKLHLNCEFHAFEPNPVFFEQLKTKIGDRPKTYLNNWGLSDVVDKLPYNNARQAFVGGEEISVKEGQQQLPLSTLDEYVREKGIERIDFLKIDTEGYDFKVLLGATETIPKCKHIQYEYWNDRVRFHSLLEERFFMSYIGGRNVLCTNKTW